MKPIIGIILREDINNQKYFLLNTEISKMIIKNNGIPIGIVPCFDDINMIINLCDGFIMQGGDDFNSYDVQILEKIWKLDKPILGICLGMQTMGYVFDGNIKNINSYNHKSSFKYAHYINIKPKTKLYEIIKEQRILVNSRHIDYLENTSLTISAISDDGIIEALEDSNKKFFIGVQWHPESLSNDLNSQKLFKSFINSCKEDL